MINKIKTLNNFIFFYLKFSGYTKTNIFAKQISDNFNDVEKLLKVKLKHFNIDDFLFKQYVLKLREITNNDKLINFCLYNFDDLSKYNIVFNEAEKSGFNTTIKNLQSRGYDFSYVVDLDYLQRNGDKKGIPLKFDKSYPDLLIDIIESKDYNFMVTFENNFIFIDKF